MTSGWRRYELPSRPLRRWDGPPAAHARENPPGAPWAWWIADSWEVAHDLLAEVDRLRAAILAFGSNPAGFDWAVLGRLEELEAENVRLRADLLAAAERVAKQSDLLSKRAATPPVAQERRWCAAVADSWATTWEAAARWQQEKGTPALANEYTLRAEAAREIAKGIRERGPTE